MTQRGTPPRGVAMQTASSSRGVIVRRDKDAITEQKCSVCDCLTREFHFGAVCCVACYAFFRRAVTEGRNFGCRKSGACPINTGNGRASCRSCRFKKCVAVGMDPAAVQPPRESIGKGKRKDGAAASTPNTLPHMEPNSLQNSDEIAALFARNEGNASAEQPNIVEDFIVAYDNLRLLRRHVYSTGSLAELIRGDPPSPRCVNIFAPISRDRLRTEFALVLQLLRQCKLFGIFDLHDKEELFKNFYLTMFVLEKFYCSMQQGGIEQRRIYHVNGTYSALDDEETLFPPEALAAHMDRETMMKLFVESCMDEMKMVVTPMRDMAMNDLDFVGFIAFNLFDPDIPTLRPERRFLVEQARSRILADWLATYTKKGITNGQLRIAKCMALLPFLKENLETRKESFHLLRVFQLLHYDEILGDLFSFKDPKNVPVNDIQTQVLSRSP